MKVRYVIFGEKENLLLVLANARQVPTCSATIINTVKTKLTKCRTDHVSGKIE